jgi:hypothetical protein
MRPAPPWPHGLGDVGGIQAAGENEGLESRHSQPPVEGQAGSRTIQQHSFSRTIVPPRKVEDFSHAHGFPYRQRGGVIRRRFVAVQLRHVQRRDAGDFPDAFTRFVDEHADAPHAGRRLNPGGALRRQVARAAPVEIEADGGGATRDSRGGVLLVGDAADLEDHAATSFFKAEEGSPDFIRCSPTRKAV